jgi:hypothetical protein
VHEIQPSVLMAQSASQQLECVTKAISRSIAHLEEGSPL